MSELTISPAEAHEAAGCIASTLRAWHNRVGFLPRKEAGWRRYTFADLISIRLMVILTSRGMTAAGAASIIRTIADEIEAASQGVSSLITVGKVGPAGEWVAESIDPSISVRSAFDFDDEAPFVLNLRSIATKLFLAICRIRGAEPFSGPILIVKDET